MSRGSPEPYGGCGEAGFFPGCLTRLPEITPSPTTIMKKTQLLLPLLIVAFLAVLAFLPSAHAKPEKGELPTQAGTGTVDRYNAHGREVYRFVPTDKELRMVKFVPGQLGYKGNKLPEEIEALLAEALAEKKAIYLECAYFDHGPGKTAIGKKIVQLKFADGK